MDRILAVLFSPKLGKVEPQTKPTVYDPILEPLNQMEEGVGKPKRKKYRDAIERHFAEGR